MISMDPASSFLQGFLSSIAEKLRRMWDLIPSDLKSPIHAEISSRDLGDDMIRIDTSIHKLELQVDSFGHHIELIPLLRT